MAPMKKYALYLFAMSLLFSSALLCASRAEPIADRLSQAMAGDHRTDKNRARDKYRHPKETLEFFGLKPDMTVVEIWPGGGWYSDILAPALKGSGKYYAATHPRDTGQANIERMLKGYDAKLKSRADVFGEVIPTEVGRKKTVIAPPGSADMVLTFRNVHNWMKRGFASVIFQAMYDGLKPGGILGVVEHRADPEDFPDPQALSGYVQEEQIKQLAADAGFEFVAASEINANPKDTHKHPKGVWTLPPSLRLGDKDKEKYLAIGESDRMTLKFRKP